MFGALRSGAAGFYSADRMVVVDLFAPSRLHFPDLQLGVVVRGTHSGVSKMRHDFIAVSSHQKLFFSDAENIRVRHIGETSNRQNDPHIRRFTCGADDGGAAGGFLFNGSFDGND